MRTSATALAVVLGLFGCGTTEEKAPQRDPVAGERLTDVSRDERSVLEGASPAEQDLILLVFHGKDRAKAKTCIGPRAPEAKTTLAKILVELRRDHPDEKVRALGHVIDSPDSERVDDEERNVCVTGWIHAVKREHEDDDDFHLLVGTDPDPASAEFMTVEVSALPKAGACRQKLLLARTEFVRLLTADWLKGATDKYQDVTPPKKVLIQGSLFFDIHHGVGSVHHGSIKPETVWEIHPVTHIEITK